MTQPDNPESLSPREEKIIALIRAEINQRARKLMLKRLEGFKKPRSYHPASESYKYIDHLRAEDFPDSLTNLINHAGINAAIRLCEEMRGYHLYSSQTKDNELNERFQRVASIIGLEHARLLYQEIKGGFLEIPSLGKVTVKARKRYVIQAFDAGKSIPEICIETGLCRRQIHKILNNPNQ